jgi:hypothetical protein
VEKQEQSEGTAPSAFISYSWDSPEHREWVIALATKLREKGIEVTLDHWHLPLGADKTLFMERAVQESDHVLLICTPKFKEKADGRLGGVGWEASIVTGELANYLTQTKFIPILREGSFATTMPRWITNRVGVDLNGEPYSNDEFERLLRDLHNEAVTPPPIGPRPTFRKAEILSTEEPTASKTYCDFSPRALLLSTELSIRSFPVVQESSWSEEEIELSVAADTSEIDAIFSRFRGHQEPLVVAYGFDVAIATLKSLNRVVSGGKTLWKAKFKPVRTEFSNDMEVGTSGTRVEKFVEKRVRRLLLNENPMSFKSEEDDMIGRVNEAMFENLVQGLNSVVKIERSGFTDLHTAFGADPLKFIEIAWISAVADLKLSASVQHIDHLTLELNSDLIHVDFSGRRHRKYVNVPPHEINVKGSMMLPAEG